MGIKGLNRFFKDNASTAIKLISLAELSGKKIAVDISIYMYKYASDGVLIENIYLMLSIFRHYNITPIFIFDGKPPTEKKELLQKRKEDKKEAEKEFHILKNKLQMNEDMDDAEKQEIISNMDLLKKKFINISKADIEIVKCLIRSYGASYYDAPGEADEICALLNIKGKVWATLSEDMDMFVYGCQRVVRYISLLNHTAVLYDVKDILDNLDITQRELREICILSGTDYNSMNDESKNSPNLYSTLKLFKKYFKERKNGKIHIDTQFYHWLQENTDYIQDIELLQKIYLMFDLNNKNNSNNNIQVFENIKIINGPIYKEEIIEILKKDGFLFPI
jgi:hypothetical protein